MIPEFLDGRNQKLPPRHGQAVCVWFLGLRSAQISCAKSKVHKVTSIQSVWGPERLFFWDFGIFMHQGLKFPAVWAQIPAVWARIPAVWAQIPAVWCQNSRGLRADFKK